MCLAQFSDSMFLMNSLGISFRKYGASLCGVTDREDDLTRAYFTSTCKPCIAVGLSRKGQHRPRDGWVSATRRVRQERCCVGRPSTGAKRRHQVALHPHSTLLSHPPPPPSLPSSAKPAKHQLNLDTPTMKPTRACRLEAYYREMRAETGGWSFRTAVTWCNETVKYWTWTQPRLPDDWQSNSHSRRAVLRYWPL